MERRLGWGGWLVSWFYPGASVHHEHDATVTFTCRVTLEESGRFKRHAVTRPILPMTGKSDMPSVSLQRYMTPYI